MGLEWRLQQESDFGFPCLGLLLTLHPSSADSSWALLCCKMFPAFVTKTTGTRSCPWEFTSFLNASRAAGITLWPRTSTPSMSNSKPKVGERYEGKEREPAPMNQETEETQENNQPHIGRVILRPLLEHSIRKNKRGRPSLLSLLSSSGSARDQALHMKARPLPTACTKAGHLTSQVHLVCLSNTELPH